MADVSVIVMVCDTVMIIASRDRSVIVCHQTCDCFTLSLSGLVMISRC